MAETGRAFGFKNLNIVKLLEKEYPPYRGDGKNLSPVRGDVTK